MKIADLWAARLLRAPADDPAGAGDPPPADPPPADPPAGAGAPPPADPPAGDPPADPPARAWYERDGFLTGEERDWIKAKGMAVDDADEVLRRAIKGHMSAEKRLGKPGDQLMDRPAKDENPAEWRRRNAAVFGIPEAAEKYEIAPPDDFPKEAWDATLEGKLREFAAEQALPQDVVQGMAGLYAQHVQAQVQASEQELQVATQEMQRELERDWGDQYPARVEIARQGAQALADKAGIGAEQLQSIAALLKPKVGDAGIMRLFHAAGEALSDDGIVPGGGGAGATTPQEAKAKLAQFTSEEGDYGKAYRAGDQRRLRELEPERQRLIQLAAGGR